MTDWRKVGRERTKLEVAYLQFHGWKCDWDWKKTKFPAGRRVTSDVDLHGSYDIHALHTLARAVMLVQVTNRTNRGDPMMLSVPEFIELGETSVDEFIKNPYPDSVVEVIAVYDGDEGEEQTFIERVWWT